MRLTTWTPNIAFRRNPKLHHPPNSKAVPTTSKKSPVDLNYPSAKNLTSVLPARAHPARCGEEKKLPPRTLSDINELMLPDGWAST